MPSHADDSAFFGHPRGLGWLSSTEFWERFSFYGMQALLVLYLTHRLLQPGHVEHVAGFATFHHAIEAVYGSLSVQALASIIFGLYAGLVYVTPIAGGLLADRVLGRTRTVIVGALLMAAGHFLMAFDRTFLIALLCLLVGVGCFKGNLAAQIGDLYAAGDKRSSDAFQIYYLTINLAVVVAPLVCGSLGELYGYHYGFGAAGIGMVLGLLVYLRGMRWLPKHKAMSRRNAAHLRSSLSPGDLRKLVLMVALLPILGLALVGNFQINNAYMLWAEANYRLSVLGLNMPVTWLLSMSSAMSILAITASVLFWRWWGKTRAQPSDISKIALGAILLAAAPLVLALGSSIVAATGQKISLSWALGFECLNEVGYANLLPVGLALYARAAPRSVAGMMVSVYTVLLFFSNMLVGWLGGLLERMSGTHFWLVHAAAIAGAAVALLLLRNLIDRTLEERDPRPVLAAAPAG